MTRTYTDTRYREPVQFTVLDGPVSVYIAPGDHSSECEIGCGECFTRLSRDELEAFARGILDALSTS